MFFFIFHIIIQNNIILRKIKKKISLEIKFIGNLPVRRKISKAKKFFKYQN
jgi:hypothetical protein